MDIGLLITGVVVGFLVAVPVGPVAVLCIQRTLVAGRAVGYSTGLGATLADTVFGTLAVFSVTAVEVYLIEYRLFIQGLGGLILIALGAHAVLKSGSIMTAAANPPAKIDHETLLHAFGTAFAITIFNPVTFLAFISLFAAIHVLEAIDGLLDSWVVITGVFAGAAGWWFALSSIAALMRQSFTGKGLSWMRVASGSVVLGFGLYAIGDLAL